MALGFGPISATPISALPDVTGNTGVLVVTLDSASFTASGVLAITGQASITLDDATLSATGVLPIIGIEGTLLDDAVLFATSTLRYDNITVPRARSNLIVTAKPKYTDITSSQSLPRQITQ